MVNNIDDALVARAVNALYKFEKKRKDKDSRTLIEGYSKSIQVQIQLVNSVKREVIRPIRVKIPHSMFDTETEEHSICFFCRTEDKDAIESYIEDHPVTGLTKIVSLDQVKKQLKLFRDKKGLLKENTHFLCDNRIVSHLYNLLGKTFSTRNNYPVPVSVPEWNKLSSVVHKAVAESTYMALKGQNITIRFGHLGMEPADVIANILAGLDFAIEKITGAWKEVHSIHIKTSDSAALPVYSRHGFSDVLRHVAENSAVEEEVVEAPKKSSSKKAKEAKSTKKSKSAPAVVEETPKKKAKTTKKTK